jgi:hypothetical protein
MRYLLQVTITILVLFLPLSIIAFQNEPNGFRGLEWGSELSSLKDIELVENDMSRKFVKVYRIRNDELIIGDAKLEYIDYIAWKGKLSEVIILAKGNVNVENLRAACIKQFGYVKTWNKNKYVHTLNENKARQTSTSLLTWRGKTTKIILRITKDLQGESGMGRLILRSREIEDQIKKEQQQKKVEEKQVEERVKGF